MILMAKMIKFDLPIDGVKVATLDQLQNHFTHDIIAHFRSGLLARWLKSRSMTRELASVEALAAGDDAAVLKELCRIFEVETDDDAITAAISEATGVPGIHLHHSHFRSQEFVQWMIRAMYYLSARILPLKASPFWMKESRPSESGTKQEWVSHLFCYIAHCDLVLGMLRGCPDQKWANDLRQHIRSCKEQSFSILGISEDEYSENIQRSPKLKSELIQSTLESKLLVSPFEDDEK